MKLFTALLLCFLCTAVQAQDKSTTRWYFGDRLGLDFNTTPPTLLSDGQSVHAEGTSVVCDAVSGALLFYTDGNTLWNRNQNVIATSINPSYSSSTQSALIIRQPGSSRLFHLFTTTNQGTGPARHFVVDMAANGGSGALTSSNNSLTPTTVTEKVTATRACNGTDYWIVFERNGNGNRGFYTFKLTSTGLDPTPIGSAVGTDILTPAQNIGAMCISPDGRYLASANYSADCQVFDFNNANGTLSNPRTVSLNVNRNCYGVSFSAGSRYLYVNSGWAGPRDSVVRFDMTAPVLQASLQTIGRGASAMGYMELAPDGKMYIARYSTNYVATISNTDAASPVFVDSAIAFPSRVYWGLPNFPQDLFIPNYAGNDTIVCPNTPVRIGIPAVSGMSYSWTPSVGLNDASIAQPTATISNATSYTVTVSDSRGCIVQRTVALNVRPRPAFTLNTDASSNTVCAGTNVELSTTVNGVQSVIWQPGNLTGSVVQVSPQQTTQYKATILDRNGCTWVDSITVIVRPRPSLSLTSTQAIIGDTTSMCSGQTVRLASSASFPSYEWSTGERTPSIELNQSSLVWLRVTDANGCTNTDTIVVRMWPLPQVNAGADAPVCSGNTFRMQGAAPTATAVRWRALSAKAPVLNDSTLLTSSLRTDTVGTFLYELEVSDVNGCVNRDTMSLNVLALPVARFSPFALDTNVCPCQSVLLQATPGTTYQWFRDTTALAGQVGQTLNVTSDGRYSVRVSDAAGCSSTSPQSNIRFIPRTALFTVSVDDSAAAGSDVHLRINAASNQMTPCADDSVTVYLRMNLYPLAPATGEQFGSIALPDQRSLPIRLKYTDAGVLKTLNYIGTLGQVDSTRITIDSVAWDNCSLPTTAVPAFFRLAGVCRARGTARLYISLITSMSIQPNPSTEVATLTLKVEEELPDCTIELRDLLGRVVQEVHRGALAAGEQHLSVPVRNLSNGMYSLHVRALGSVNTLIVEVQK